jgi:parallel beta-helix repeat protein
VEDGVIEPSDGLIVTEDTVFRPGVYLLREGITVAADGVTVNGNGAVLIGDGRKDRGVTVIGRKAVTIEILAIRDYHHGILAYQCADLTIVDCQVTSTAEMPANTIFLNIWKTAENAYGGGIMLWDVHFSRVEGNDLQHQMNGLLSYHCGALMVRGNNASYCSGFGFHLYETSDSLFEANYADFCCRYHPRGELTGHMGADAAGFVIVHNSCGNIFRRNNARLSGDGFFLAGLAPQGAHAGCNDNLFDSNDGSYSPNIAFEATFSKGNVYKNNRASYSNYGFWLGFSEENLLQENQIWHNRQAGVAVENGIGMTLKKNVLHQNGHGVLLWSKYVDAFAIAVPQNDTSRDWLLEGNQFVDNRKGIRIAGNQDHGVRPLPADTPTTPRPNNHTIRHNSFRSSCIGIELELVEGTVLEGNRFRENVEADVKEV